MSKKPTPPSTYQNIYPSFRYMMGAGRSIYGGLKKLTTNEKKRPLTSKILPDRYTVCNTSTLDSDFSLHCLAGAYPTDIEGSLHICQCLGVPEAFMVGDTNMVRIDFDQTKAHLTNRLMWTPAALARLALEKSKHRFSYMGLMFTSPGLGMYSYTEGMYLLPDGRIAVTSDVDRPWVVERDSLRATTPLGKRSEWLPMMSGTMGEVMGNLFAGYSNSHVMYTDFAQKETFFVNYQYKQADGSHPVNLIKWDGKGDFKHWLVLDEQGKQIEIKQSIHELVFTRDYILLADTAFIAGTEMMTPWNNAPLPLDKTVMYIIPRKGLTDDNTVVTAKKFTFGEPCIHLIPEYENPADKITVYMLHTPATNTAEILHNHDRNLEGELFAKHLVGYGTLPVLDLSSVGKHVLDMGSGKVEKSEYIAEQPFTWGPYLYAYMGRQTKPFQDQDLFVMFKGFAKEMLPKRIYKAYKDIDNRRVPIEEMVGGEGINQNNSICRIAKDEFKITDSYVFPDKVLLYTMACLDEGYVLTGVVTDSPASEASSGHEYWLFDASDLAKGPICKLGHTDLNNSTLFHTVYLPKEVRDQFDAIATDARANQTPPYTVPLREDYPETELTNWRPEVLRTFTDLIYPYFEGKDPAALEALATHRVRQHCGTEEVIGEEAITDAPAFAARMFAEAERMWQSNGWKVEYDKKGVLVESKPISGTLAKSGVLMTRCVGEINANAQELFDLMISPEGYAIIDPVCKPEDHKRPPLEAYDWHEGGRLEAAIATTTIPTMGTSEFVVLNAMDSNTRTFISKSILHSERPGGSIYSDAGAPKNGTNRALNTFGVKIVPIDDCHCRVYGINYADMAGKTGAAMNNMINTKYFFPPLYKRMKKAMEK
ncbi:MAG: hypothetical protein R3Y06_00160 [Faecalibacterium sp.]